MDLDDFDPEPPKAAAAAAAKFVPKSRLKKLQPKPEPRTHDNDTPPPPQPVVVAVKEEKVEEMDIDDDDDILMIKKELMDTASGVTALPGIADAAKNKDKDKDKEEDYVVAEYDVYYNKPAHSDTQLYVMQHPLRPSWRPYELDQRCTEVRVKPIAAEVEVDLSVEVDTENYDPDCPFAAKMQKQTLSSSGRAPHYAAYAVGLLRGKKLYLNPIHAAVQLRTSTAYLDFGDPKKNTNNVVREEGKSNDSSTGSSAKQNKETAPEVVESWIPLKYHSSTTDLARTYLRKMVTEEGSPLQFSMNPYDYLNSLCHKEVTDKMKSTESFRRSLLSLPLEERLKTLFMEGSHIQRFNAIKHLTPDDEAERVLGIVEQHANLVQGVWVAKSGYRYQRGVETAARDYALSLFSEKPFVKDSELKSFGFNFSTMKQVIKEIAVERPDLKDWKFREPTDVSFMRSYPDIVEKQRKKWQVAGEQMREKFTKAPGSKNRTQSISAAQDIRPATNEARSASMSMSKEAREVLSKILGKLFLSHKVCSFQAILQGLRDTTVGMSQPSSKNKAAVSILKHVIDAPREELQAVISDYSVEVHHGLYVLKPSSEHPELNPLRNDIIDLFRGREPGATVKKGEITEAARVSASEFQKVINEYCVSKGGAWVLKGGAEVTSSDWQSIFKAAKLM